MVHCGKKLQARTRVLTMKYPLIIHCHAHGQVHTRLVYTGQGWVLPFRCAEDVGIRVILQKQKLPKACVCSFEGVRCQGDVQRRDSISIDGIHVCPILQEHSGRGCVPRSTHLRVHCCSVQDDRTPSPASPVECRHALALDWPELGTFLLPSLPIPSHSNLIKPLIPIQCEKDPL
jgi:hypothetical protein